MLAILAPIFVFGLVIFVHELGHFLAAKATGVYAPRFSIGFGPALFRRRQGETEYILALFPLGGYVRMASRHDEETAFLEGGSEEKAARAADAKDYDPNAMIPFGPKPVPEHRWFESKPLPARLLIMIAGVVMNVLLAIVVSSGLAWHFGRSVYPTTVVGAVHAPAAIPELTSLRVLDTIVRVNGASVSNWNDVADRIRRSKTTIDIATTRGETRVPVRSPDTPPAVADAIVYYIPPIIDSLVPGEPAQQAGLRRGDSIVAISGKAIRSWTDMVDTVAVSAGKALAFDVRSAGQPRTVVVTPKEIVEADPSTGAQRRPIGRIGAAARDRTRIESLGVIGSVTAGTRVAFGMAGSVFGFLRDLFVGRVSVAQLGGPIAITKASVSAARNGIEELFYLIALLSINVAILNLFPIPILDGGQILINVLESAKGSPFSLRTREYILRFGLLAIALLFAIVMYNDTHGSIARLFEWVAKRLS